ncbi:MAG: DsbC family protein [Glaciimonas sp.]|nr:DsbC family protein [Glaciimonas sp.]
MHQLYKLAFAAILTLPTSWALAQTAQELAVKKMIEPRLGQGAKVDSVTKTPYSGLFEVRVGSDILYTDEKAKYLFIGRILDTKTYQDYTKTRVDELSKIKFSDLPLASAMKVVKGNGKRVIAVFEDPNCGYCKRFDKTLQEVDNITVYTFLYNILSEDSITKARDIWCSADRSKAWDNWMLNGKVAPAAAAGCTTPHEKILALGKKLKVTGTPTIFFVDGTRIPGAIDAQGLEAKLVTIK